jgi:hypothetical protein
LYQGATSIGCGKPRFLKGTYVTTASQAARRLGFVSGRDFKEAAEKPRFSKGMGFSPYVTTASQAGGRLGFVSGRDFKRLRKNPDFSKGTALART